MDQQENDDYSREQQWKHFEKTFLNYNELPQQEQVEYFVKKIKEIEALSLESKRFHFLLDHKKFYPRYVSQNVAKESGYTSEYLDQQNLLFIFKNLHWSHITMPAKVHIWGNKCHKKYGHLYKPGTVKTHFCGLKLKDKWGNWRSMIFSQKLLTFSKNRKPLLSYIEAEEITAFHQSNTLWYRIEIETEYEPIVKVFFNNINKKEASEILSKRELEILKLSAKHKTNKEIAENLDISKNTVERHRKNMLAKTGVTNMVGLLRVAQIVNLI